MRSFLIILLLALVQPGFAAPVFTNGILNYQPTAARIEGEIIVRGSTRLEPMIRKWFSEFSTFYPDIRTNIEASGSGAAPKALIAGIANVGAMSRRIKQKEIDAFEQAKGYRPLELVVAMDALAVYVNRKNPINQLTLEQVEAIYSQDQKCMQRRGKQIPPIDDWQQLGWDQGGPIEAHNFHSESGGYSLFRKLVLCKGNYTKGLWGNHKTSIAMTNAVSQSISTIGFASRSGSKGYGSKIIALSRSTAFPYYYPDPSSIASDEYPLSRFLFLYLDQPPNEPMPRYLEEFLKYVYSVNGQKTIEQAGAIPLTALHIGKQLAAINHGRNR